MKIVKNGIILILGLTVVAFGNLTPQKYWELEISIRALTIEGMQKRLECLEREECSLDKQMLISNEYESKISNLFKSYNTTPSKELSYENKNRKILQKYLEEHESILNKIESLKEEFQNYSNRLTAIMEERQ